MSADATCRKAPLSRCARILTIRNRVKTSMTPAISTTPSIGCLRMCPTIMATPESGYLLSRLLHLGKHDRFSSGTEGCVAAGSDDKLIHGRRCLSWRRFHACGQLWLLCVLQAARQSPVAAEDCSTFRLRHE